MVAGDKCIARAVGNRLFWAVLKSYKAKRKKAKVCHNDWSSKVNFFDESSFHLLQSTGHVMVRLRPGEVYKPPCLAHMVKSGEGSVIWGDLHHSTVLFFYLNTYNSGSRKWAYNSVILYKSSAHFSKRWLFLCSP